MVTTTRYLIVLILIVTKWEKASFFIEPREHFLQAHNKSKSRTPSLPIIGNEGLSFISLHDLMNKRFEDVVVVDHFITSLRDDICLFKGTACVEFGAPYSLQQNQWSGNFHNPHQAIF